MAEHVDESYDAPQLVTRSYEKPTLLRLRNNRAQGKPGPVDAESDARYGPS